MRRFVSVGLCVPFQCFKGASGPVCLVAVGANRFRDGQRSAIMQQLRPYAEPPKRRSSDLIRSSLIKHPGTSFIKLLYVEESLFPVATIGHSRSRWL